MNPEARRTALVTGAARGQGRAIVRRLIADGFDVVACDVRADELDDSVSDLQSDRVLAQTLDVTSAAEWSSAVAATQERFGRLDALVSNAGIHRRGFVLDEEPDEFEWMWRVNCLSLLHAIRACVPLMRESDSGVIVCNLSVNAVRTFPSHSAYTASKFGARGLALSAAADLGPLGIRVNCVLPGPVATSMHDPDALERLGRVTMMNRVAEPEEIAGVVAFLLSPDAAFLVGAEIVVDGGQGLKAH
ncbi:MAG: SDR family oxidoreductase [Aeromicrobium sp.]